MPKHRVVIIAPIAAFALYLIAASSASASWLVAGVPLPEGSKAALTSTAKVDGDTVFKIDAAIPVKVLCKATVLHAESAEIIGEAEGLAKSFTFEGCETTEPATNCTLEGQPTSIKTEPIEMAVSTGSKSSGGRITILPQTKTSLATIPFSGTNTCALKKHEPLLGAVRLSAPKLGNEETVQAIEGLGAEENAAGLEVGGNAVLIEGSLGLLKLSSGAKFGFKAPFFVKFAKRTVKKGANVSFKILDGGAGSTVTQILVLSNPGGQYEFTPLQVELCEGKYIANEECEFTVTYKAGGSLGARAIVLVFSGANVTSDAVLGVA